MSLINDALKRARQAQKRPATSPSAEGIVTVPSLLQPVEDSERERPQRLLVVLPVLLLSLGASFWLLTKWKNAERHASPSSPHPELTDVQPSSAAQTNALTVAAATITKWKERQQTEVLDSSPEVNASVQGE